jgi:hypothetical protein
MFFLFLPRTFRYNSPLRRKDTILPSIPFCSFHSVFACESVFQNCADYSYVMVASVTLVPLFGNCIIKFVCRNSVAGIATRCGLDGPGIESRWLPGFAPVQTSPGAQLASCTMGTGLLPRVKRSGRGVNQPPHRKPRLKKE